MSDSSPEASANGFKKYVVVVHAIGTCGNMTVARMYVTWSNFLYALSKRHPEIATIYSQLFHFVFANTHEGSIKNALRIVRIQDAKTPGISFSAESHLMLTPNEKDEMVASGKGAVDLDSGQKSAAEYLARDEVKALIDNAYFYFPISSLGTGNTGSATIGPLVDMAAKSDTRPWVFPTVILSTPMEMRTADADNRNNQEKVLDDLNSLPVWLMIAHNEYLTRTSDEWNVDMTSSTGYSRIDYPITHAIRVLLMMLLHRDQIDESKLEGKIFKGPGAVLKIGGANVNPDGDRAEEVKRLLHVVAENPFGLEKFPHLGERLPKFDVLVTGTMGQFPGPMESLYLEAKDNHPFIAEHLQEATVFNLQFASFLGKEGASGFMLMKRTRENLPDPFELPPYPPDDHPLLGQLIDLEIEATMTITPETLGREEVKATAPAPQKAAPAVKASAKPQSSVAKTPPVTMPAAAPSQHSRVIETIKPAVVEKEFASFADLLKAHKTIPEMVQILKTKGFKVKATDFDDVMQFLHFIGEASAPELQDIPSEVFEQIYQIMISSAGFALEESGQVLDKRSNDATTGFYHWSGGVEDLKSKHKNLQARVPADNPQLINLRNVASIKAFFRTQPSKKGASYMTLLMQAGKEARSRQENSSASAAHQTT